ncbi:adenylate cyclase [Bradyrhizobium yuanmingense]|uniref:Adenylate cyclase, class 3 n=1 Tax=Bradyrhizobium yuanmingense TaxID=108015 RepID=A0A1C3WLM5_9BRAD|nr:adenylate/guanylate cyclase domain-containing protein [Bradyrhizobium yuanmingense]TWI24451.1 class 3 adenylate cyclase [Bradyrhizobium yuanmingense]SCB40947.1 Adenylate cyclase, class 3 [Bradyrhizobium yuanmingense]
MKIYLPDNEQARQQALETYRILDTPPEIAYDELADLAAQICGCSAGLLTFLDDKRQWLKAKCGLPPDLTHVPKEISICQATICHDDLMYVPDLTKDPRFSDSPLVAGEFGLRFYCGMPLISEEGYALGTLCVIDFEPRELSFEQQEAVRRISRQAVAQLELRRRLRERDEMLAELDKARAMAEAERSKSDALLLNILPPAIAEELKANAKVRPRFYQSVSILFVDFADFTRHVEAIEPAQVVHQLDEYYSTFDEIIARHRLEKIKTIGDAYLCAGGLPEINRTHAVDAALAALEIQDLLAKANRQRERLRLPLWMARIGINTGPVIAGVVGTRKFSYDIWGNAVNVAARLQAAADPGRINIAEATWNQVKARFTCEPRGSIEVKGKGPTPMYFLDRIRPDLAADPAGVVPNDSFWRHQGP